MSGGKYRFEVNVTSTAPAERLFALVADAPSWSGWAKPLAGSWDRAGDPAGGLGAIRRIGRTPVWLRERTVAYEPGRRHAYELLTPGPMRDYSAEVLFTERPDGGTDVRWQGTFRPTVPGTGPALAAGARLLIGRLARRLVAAAERG